MVPPRKTARQQIFENLFACRNYLGYSENRAAPVTGATIAGGLIAALARHA
jgi:hypothetical protein